MYDEIDWNALERLSELVTQSGESPGAFPDAEWERIHSALIVLQEAGDWGGIIRLRKLFSGLYARDSAWGIPIIQTLDMAAVEAARQLGDAAELGHLQGARGHNLHRQGLHKQAIIAFEDSAKNYLEIGNRFSALKAYS